MAVKKAALRRREERRDEEDGGEMRAVIESVHDATASDHVTEMPISELAAEHLVGTTIKILSW